MATTIPTSPEAGTPVKAKLRSPTETELTAPVADTPEIATRTTVSAITVPTAPEAGTPVRATSTNLPTFPTVPKAVTLFSAGLLVSVTSPTVPAAGTPVIA